MGRRTLVGHLLAELRSNEDRSPIELAETLEVELPSVYAAKNRAVEKLDNSKEQPSLFGPECKEQIVAPRMDDGTVRYKLTRDPDETRTRWATRRFAVQSGHEATSRASRGSLRTNFAAEHGEHWSIAKPPRTWRQRPRLRTS